MTQTNWDQYFLNICQAVAENSKCLSRKLGAVLVRHNSIVATGYNGPARGVAHCTDTCPRRKAGYPSGEGLHLCPATHAEANCIANAARLGVCTEGCTLYLNWLTPCKDCLSLLINAGIDEIVTSSTGTYDYLTGKILESPDVYIQIRTVFTV
jgi:dCMP deaminase